MHNAIISVSDKTNIEKIGDFLLNNGFTIYSTGGTLKYLQTHLESNTNFANIRSIYEITDFPEILNGRVKTLHPKIYGGLLADLENEEHIKQLEEHHIQSFDVVIVNLYPFEKKVKDNPSNETQCIENIDIGGVSLIRASSKNYKYVTLLSNVSQYQRFMDNYPNISPDYRHQLATNGFAITTKYDELISNYYGSNKIPSESNKIPLKYGINPHQNPSYLTYNTTINSQPINSPPFTVLSGIIGYINTLDAIHGWLTVREIEDILNIPAVISMKHTSPAGLGIGTDLDEETCMTFGLPTDANDTLSPVAKAFAKARNCDPLSSFGDFIICSSEVDESMAKLVKREVTDGIMAPSYTPEALEILKKKKSGRYIILLGNMDYYQMHKENGWQESKSIYGITFHQPSNNYRFDINKIKTIYSSSSSVYDSSATAELEKHRESIVISYTVLKYAQSNNVCMVWDGQVIGLGAGQQNRVDCVRLAGKKARKWILRRHPLALDYLKSLSKDYKRQEKVNLVYRWIDENCSNDNFNELMDRYKLILASDGFFPFPDNIEVADTYGVKYVIQPGGSMMDETVVIECQKRGMIMAITGSRVFYH